MAKQLAGKRIAFVVANEGIEQVELTRPWDAVQAAGGQPCLIAPDAGEVQAYNHLDPAESFPVDETVAAASPEDFDALVLPGGVANADQIRAVPQAVDFVRSIVEAGKPVGVICHGPWILIEAEALRGRTITSWPSLKTDLRNAGANWVDKELVDDDGPFRLISSRKPDDLDAFCPALVEAFAKSRQLTR